MDATLTEELDRDLFTGYPVRIEIFEGPVDLLLHLVRREQIDISEISLAEITGQYLEYLRAMQAINIAVAGQFVETAATLLQIKSRQLLPVTAEEVAEDDEDELELLQHMHQRLAQYRVFQQAADALGQSRQLRQQVYLRSLTDDDDLPSGFLRLQDVSIFDLVGAVRDLFERAEASATPHSVEQPTITLPQRIEEILFHLRASSGGPLTFVELVGVPVTRQLIIFSFLAILELIRRGRIYVRQQAARSEILIQLASQSQSDG